MVNGLKNYINKKKIMKIAKLEQKKEYVSYRKIDSYYGPDIVHLAFLQDLFSYIDTIEEADSVYESFIIHNTILTFNELIAGTYTEDDDIIIFYYSWTMEDRGYEFEDELQDDESLKMSKVNFIHMLDQWKEVIKNPPPFLWITQDDQGWISLVPRQKP